MDPKSRVGCGGVRGAGAFERGGAPGLNMRVNSPGSRCAAGAEGAWPGGFSMAGALSKAFVNSPRFCCAGGAASNIRVKSPEDGCGGGCGMSRRSAAVSNMRVNSLPFGGSDEGGRDSATAGDAG